MPAEQAGGDDPAFARLLAACGIEGGLVALRGSSAGSRGLVAARPVSAGDAVFSVPWTAALTPASAVAALVCDEARKQGLLPGGVAQLQRQLQAGLPELPAAAGWTLLLALQLLRELRDPRSPLQPYAQVLPAPPGSLVKAVASCGPDATDLLLFSEAELAQLQCGPLATDVCLERQRLAALHTRLFCTADGKPPAVSFASFLWASSLVRSRSLDLTGTTQASSSSGAATAAAAAAAAAGEPFRERCLLPTIDLCNHSAEPSCSLSVGLSSSGQPRWVHVLARKDLAAGAELLLDYGSRPLRDFLQGYGFVPGACAAEVFEDFGCPWETLHVRGSPQGRTLWLSAAHCQAPEPPHTGGLQLAYIVCDESTLRPEAAGRPPVLTLPTGPTAQGSGSGSRTAVAGAAPSLQVRQLDGCQEAALARHVADTAAELLGSFPTTAAQDAALLASLDSLAAAAAAAAAEKQETERTYSGSPEAEIGKEWFAEQHLRMALQFRCARKRLLARVAADLQVQAVFASPARQQ